MERKPLGVKAYGHIPHLPSSRLGPGDHYVSEGQAKICTEQPRDRHDLIIVQEKVDGSCVAVAKIEDNILPLIRSGYVANTSPWLQHQFFYDWVYQNYERFSKVLENGERLCGEWLAQAHGTRYKLPHEPFVAFDLIDKQKRVTLEEFTERIRLGEFTAPRLIHKGIPVSLEQVKEKLEPSGHGALDSVEGAIWRVERKGVVDFLAKWVRHDKLDGCFLPEISGQEAIWNWHP